MIAYVFAILLVPTHVTSGRATTYWPGDGMNPGYLPSGRKFTRHQRHVAHRWLRLGTRGVICSLRTLRCAETSPEDRGPWGAVRPCAAGLGAAESFLVGVPKWRTPRRIRWLGRCHWWHAQVPRRLPGWRYRGAFDLTRPISKALHHRSFDRVAFFWRKHATD